MPQLPPLRPTVGQRSRVVPVRVRYGPPEVTGTKVAEVTYRPPGSPVDALVEVYRLDPVPIDPADPTLGTRVPYAVVYDDCPWDDQVGAVIWVAHDLDHLRASLGAAIPLPPPAVDALRTQLALVGG